MSRDELLADLVARLPGPDGRCVLLGIDGPDGAGKTVFADRLAEVVRARRAVIRLSLDDFHHVAAVRYRRGRDSPEGFWLDSYDYARFAADVLEPLSAGGDGRYRAAAHDLASDAVLEPPWRSAPPDAVVIVDGLFLHRDELAGCWDLSVFLDVAPAITARRMAQRDGTHPDPAHPSMRRYVEAQRIYRVACRPTRRATFVIDNSNWDEPVLLLRERDLPTG